MGYLKWKHNSRLFFDPTYPDIDFDTFNYGDEWKTFYGDVTEAIPQNAPDPREILLTYVCGLIVTTQETKRHDDHAQGILYS